MELKAKKEQAAKVLKILSKEFPSSKPALNFETPFQLLIATILSAQCTDERVNIVTKELFKKYLMPEDFLKVDVEELEKDIYSTGFYKNKAKNIRKCCQQLVNEHNSKVPADFDKLTQLSGVGRKTASVVAGNAFGIPSIAVDTHVIRLSNLLGFVDGMKNADKIEAELKQIFPQKVWTESSHWLQRHGRNTCIARRPKCDVCKISKYCPSYSK